MYVQTFVQTTEGEEQMKATRERVNYRLPRDVVRAAATRAIKDRVSVTDVVEAALRVYLGVYPAYVRREAARAAR